MRRRLALVRDVDLLVDGERPATAARFGAVSRAGGGAPGLVAPERSELGRRHIATVAPSGRTNEESQCEFERETREGNALLPVLEAGKVVALLGTPRLAELGSPEKRRRGK